MSLQDYNPELLESMPTLSYPELFSDDNALYFSEFNEDRPYGPLEDVQALNGFRSRLIKLNGIVRKILTMENIVNFNIIIGGIHHKEREQHAECWWDLDPETLSANEALYLVCYPFFDRWGGSWEVRFALSGDLGKYLSLYQRKLLEETGQKEPESPQEDKQ